MNLLINITEQQWRILRAAGQRSGKDPSELLYRALELGWPALERELSGVPKPPVRLHVVK